MLNLRKTLENLARNQGRWERLMRGASRVPQPEPAATASALEEVHGFGSNPGNLRMLRYLPARLAAAPPLVVVLHGCKQTAAGYDHGAGWSTLADRLGFALLLPEQRQANNPNNCFNWFLLGDTARDQGEALSVRQMIERMVVDHGVDRRRVFVTGLSAGGAMTSVMLACYPEVFSGGAIIAGLPYGAAANVQQAFESMFQSPPRAAREWGDRVRRATLHRGPWPRISVWHGDADKTVIPANAGEILKQWTDVHGLAAAASQQAMVDGYPRRVWMNDSGDEVIELWTIAGMAHGTPLATAAAEGACGAAGPFLLEAGISSSWHIAKFFGLAEAGLRATAPMRSEAATIVPRQPYADTPAAAPQAHARNDKLLHGDVLEKERTEKPEPRQAPRPGPIDVGGVITKALKAAGLMKGR